MRHLNFYCDGSCYNHPTFNTMGIGVFCPELDIRISEYEGYGTNNIAEYKAVIMALLYIARLIIDSDFKVRTNQQYKNIYIYSDSQIVVRQLNGNYQVHNENLLQQFLHATGLITALRKTIKINIEWTHRSTPEQQIADELSRKGNPHYAEVEGGPTDSF